MTKNLVYVRSLSPTSQTLNRSSFHACVLAPRPGSAVQRRRGGSVRPEQPERTVTMSFSIGPTESQRQNRAPSSRPTATDPERRQLRPSAAGCPGEREGLWHRRTLFWRTSSGVQVVSPRAGKRLSVGGSGPTGRSDLDSAGGLVEDERAHTCTLCTSVCALMDVTPLTAACPALCVQ